MAETHPAPDPAESAVYAVLREHPGISQEDVVRRVSARHRFQANFAIRSLLSAGKLVEVGGKVFIPGRSALVAQLRDPAHV
ncbi:MAG: hypothetical protein KBD16_01745 [Candidatus Pacebacteria bacterium]|nr:hypothetical protein [Candidatus Paceibacterota bacterium]